MHQVDNLYITIRVSFPAGEKEVLLIKYNIS